MKDEARCSLRRVAGEIAATATTTTTLRAYLMLHRKPLEAPGFYQRDVTWLICGELLKLGLSGDEAIALMSSG